jgi:hypothetical protein
VFIDQALDGGMKEFFGDMAQLKDNTKEAAIITNLKIEKGDNYMAPKSDAKRRPSTLTPEESATVSEATKKKRRNNNKRVSILS